ncbi:MAG: YbhB/YbcL family Raf kinase inhibitor-like protein [Chloroflexi bacterium]|nr:YbhB/YbcL family Raf kinase inhibitor-like protein [Chloroflexota bacterium]
MAGLLSGCCASRPAAPAQPAATPAPTLAAQAPATESSPTAALKLASPAFEDQGPIPARYTCDGENVSPPLQWGPTPPGTRSWVLIMDDPDAPGGVWDHWIVYDIPAQVTQLAEGQTPPGRQGRNSWGHAYYEGPCPPPGPAHRYVFRLFALDVPSLGLPEAASKAQVLAAMEGHVLSQAQLIGTYGR